MSLLMSSRDGSKLELDVENVGQDSDFVDQEIGQIPNVGYELAAGNKSKVENIEIALHGYVQALAVDHG